jgi:hypothetical protein
VTVTGASTDYPHAIAYDGSALFVTTTAYDNNALNKIYKIDLPGLTLSATSLPTYSTMCDEIVVTGDKVYVGKESSDGHILVIDKSGSPFTKDSIYTGISAACYGVFFDGMYIWATMAGTPGGLSRINPITGEVSYMTFASGYNNTNEVAFHGGRMLLTFYQTNFGIGRICLPEMISVAHGSLTNPMTTSQDMIVGGADGVPTRLPKGNNGDVLSITSGTVGWVASGGGGMVYPGVGIPISTGSAWGTSITNNSAHWETAYDDRLKWDGGSTGLTAATGRTSLGLGDMALETKANYALLNNPTFTTGIGLAGTGVASFNTDDLQLYGNGEGFLSSKENNVAIGVKDGGGDFEYVMKANYNSGNSAFEANYNGSKVFETDADGVNISSGKVYQVNGTNGITGTYTNPTVTFTGGIAINAEDGEFDYKSIVIQVFSPTETITTGTGVGMVSIPANLNGWTISSVEAHAYDGTSGQVEINLINSNSAEVYPPAQGVLSTKAYIDNGEHDSKNATTRSVVGYNSLVYEGYTLGVNIDAAGTNRKGLDVRITFTK